MTAPSGGDGSGKIITLEEGWNKINTHGVQKLQHIIQNGIRESFSNAEYADLYTTIYQMCTQKAPHSYTSHLYDKYTLSINSYLQSVALPAIASQTGEFMIRELVKRWEDHKIMRQWMVSIFMYLDRFFVKRHNKKPLGEVATGQFRALVFNEVKVKAAGAVLELITRDRMREEVDRDLLRDAVQIFVDMGMGTLKTYQADFEAAFLQQTETFYAREAASWVAMDGAPEYLRKTELRFAQERKRLKDYLHSSSDEKLMERLYHTLLIQHQGEVLAKENTGIRVMLQTHAQQDLARMFALYSCVPPSLDPISKSVKQHIQAVGQSLIDKVNAEKNHGPYIDELMKIHDKYHDLVVNCFRGHAIFHKALKEAFEHVVNVRTYQSSTAELLASYSDNILNKGGIKLSEKALMSTLDNLVRLFSYLIDKDMFSEFYRKKLATRLLLQRSASTDAEKSMIGKLKLKCGAQFTSKFEGMINDMKTAEDHQVGFRDFIKDRQINLGIDFTVLTLTSGYWPTYPTDEVALPPSLNTCLDTFKVYYNTKTNNRKLRWIHNLGVVTITAGFTKRRVDLVVSGIQAAILLLFNEQPELSIEEISKHTKLSPENLKQQLRSLASGQYKILLKNPAEGYKETHKIRVNKGFTHAQRRIRLPSAAAMVTDADRKVAQTAVTEDRRHAVEAAIVRIMKSRKTLTHQQLVSEVSAQLMQYFQPDPRIIKKRIEDLIAREYLERDAEKSNVYNYLA